MTSLKKLFIYYSHEDWTWIFRRVVSSLDTGESCLPPQLAELHMLTSDEDDLSRGEELLSLFRALAAKMQALETITWCLSSYDVFRWLEPSGETRVELMERPGVYKSPWVRLIDGVFAAPLWYE